jgi:hypothetical protein
MDKEACRRYLRSRTRLVTQNAGTVPIEEDYCVGLELWLEATSTRQRAQIAELGHIGLAAAEWSDFGSSSRPASGKGVAEARAVVIGSSELEKKIKKRQFIVVLQGGYNS